MQVPEGVTDYCTTYADCATRFPDLVTKWDAFYQGLKAASVSDASDLEKKDHVLGLYWEAHQASMGASASCLARSYYSSTEVSFANQLADLRRLHSRRGGTAAPNIADLSAEENHSLYIFSWMRSMNTVLDPNTRDSSSSLQRGWVMGGFRQYMWYPSVTVITEQQLVLRRREICVQ
ncbi:Protein LEG1 [Merluccius polli]|uniref:Protein LEG1 n=1 Tax=Merluccius polli TaxID=89951 RepID=A0AA47NAI5_MERPO|nr:Protein LEG1 [Merluccius polli]